MLWPGPRNVRGVLYEKRETFRKVCYPGRTGFLDGRGHWVTVVSIIRINLDGGNSVNFSVRIMKQLSVDYPN